MAEEQTTPTPAEITEVPAAPVVKKKKVKRSVPYGQVHIMATFNNTIVTVTDTKGGALTYSSSGACGFRGSKKGTAYAAQIAAEKALAEAKQNYGLNKADVYVRGIGMGRDAAIRAMQVSNIALEAVHDVTGIPHGGVRPKKARRV
ncbi:30S ribosomal protein S11 [Candidatus Saccharibacteria bacterium]|nr:30S ribosomal protein S11 [Candidatus Saccharibacteria bacterium]